MSHLIKDGMILILVTVSSQSWIQLVFKYINNMAPPTPKTFVQLCSEQVPRIPRFSGFFSVYIYQNY